MKKIKLPSNKRFSRFIPNKLLEIALNTDDNLEGVVVYPIFRIWGRGNVARYLITSAYPFDDQGEITTENIGLFGIGDLGLGFPEYGSVSLKELEEMAYKIFFQPEVKSEKLAGSVVQRHEITAFLRQTQISSNVEEKLPENVFPWFDSEDMRSKSPRYSIDEYYKASMINSAIPFDFEMGNLIQNPKHSQAV